MGNLTTITIYNDGCHLIKEHPQEFAERVYEACSERKRKSYPVGNHYNLITAQGTKHADEHTIYVHAGNTVCEMNQWSDYTEDIMKRNPKFFKEMLDFMDSNVKELKKRYKEFKTQTNESNQKK